MILILLAAQLRSQTTNLDELSSHTLKAKTVVFGTWVERDVLALGKNLGNKMQRFDVPTVDAAGNTTRWTFFSDSTLSTGTQSRLFTQYRLARSGQVAFRDTTYQTYQMTRYTVLVPFVSVDAPPPVPATSAPDWAQTWSSYNRLSFFRIQILNALGEAPLNATGAIDVAKARLVRIQFEAVPEYNKDSGTQMEEVYWFKTLKVRPYWDPLAPV